MTPEDAFKKACEDFLPKINTWDDMYRFFGELMAKAKDGFHPAYVLDALFSMYGFLLSMKELPEEGDIKVLFTRMFRILLVEGEEKVGIKISLMTKDEADAKIREATAGAISVLLQGLSDAAPGESVPEPKNKTLH